jgi:hypothetical protein
MVLRSSLSLHVQLIAWAHLMLVQMVHNLTLLQRRLSTVELHVPMPMVIHSLAGYPAWDLGVDVMPLAGQGQTHLIFLKILQAAAHGARPAL